jgi:pyruvate dehydrogenase E2 component (dihydrolipoamide acetyltransferase)
MATKVILPMLGETMEEGTVTQWLRQEGDKVEKGEPLLEVMTDKVNMEVESPASGILRKILAQPEETIPVMALIGIIGTADEPIDDILAEAESAEPAKPKAGTSAPPTLSPAMPIPADMPTPASSHAFISPRAKSLARERRIPLDELVGRGTGPGGRIVEKDVLAYVAGMTQIKATPLAAKMAADKGISLRGATGSGPRGKITRDDVLRAATYPVLEAKVIPLTGMRKLVADNVAKSAQTAPHVTLTMEVDMTELVRTRAQILGEFEKKYSTKITFTDLILKAAARALPDHPMVNASLQGNEIHIHGEVNIGVAVALEGGLIVPVVRNADRKSLAEISVELKSLAEKARSGGLSTNEITGGTFTITNLGAYGVDYFNPIITPGQSAILGVCRIAEKPVVIESKVVIRSMMNLCLSFDHRVMDGAPAALFLKRIKELLETSHLISDLLTTDN